LTGLFASWAFDINVALDRREGLSALEVGAGYGDILIYLRERGCQTAGTDLSEAAVAKGREYGIDMRYGHLKDVGLPSGSFDIAIMCHSLEHVPQPRVELAELSRLVKKGGRLHIAVPNGHAVRMDQDQLEWAHLSHPLHFWYFDGENLARLLHEYGFEPVIGPKTTTRHHALNAWRDQFRKRGVGPATRVLLNFLKASMSRSDGGDVLRVVAERR
jgi:ubiquinone/menaquinone biosynthesis C-methylase UbiE